MPSSLGGLETPCLIADRARLAVNAERMRDRAEQVGVRLRPHVKTTKSAAIARLAHGDRVGPITVSTLQEAEYFFASGFRDITYAVALSQNKIARACALKDRGAELKLLIASEAAAASLALASNERPRAKRLDVMLEIDCGEHRTGFEPRAPALISTAKRIHAATGLRLLGLLTHGGQSYQATSRADVAAVAEQERICLLDARDSLQAEGLQVDVLSSGSTPTAVFGENFEGIDEIRPGVYLAGDLFQAQLGVLSLEDIAVTVLSSVIAHDTTRNRLVIDAGGLALSKDRSTANSPRDFGYGLLLRADGTALPVDAIVRGVHQEHGEVGSVSPLPFEDLPIGSLVRVMPNHVCMTAASYDRYFVTDGPGTNIVDTWEKTYGW